MTEPLLTLPEASAALGLDPRGRRLRRLLLAHERSGGEPVGERVRGEQRVAWRVTMGALRLALPSLFAAESLDALGREVRSHIAGLDARIDTRAEVVARRVLAPVRRELEARDEAVARMVVDVARSVGVVARAAGVADAVKPSLTAPRPSARPQKSPL